MTTADKGLSPQESLDLIVDSIAKTKANIRETSGFFLLWGWLITIASFSFFLLHQFTSFSYYFLAFPVLVLPGIVITLLWYFKRKSRTTITYLSHFLSKLWLVLGISFITVVFINVVQGLSPFTYTLLVAGIGTSVSGLAMKFRPLVFGGIIFLIAALASIFVYDDYQSLLHGVAIVFGYLIPGYLLKNTKA